MFSCENCKIKFFEKHKIMISTKNIKLFFLAKSAKSRFLVKFTKSRFSTKTVKSHFGQTHFPAKSM